MTETRTPLYCAKCGSRLLPSDSVTGYDPYTGDPLKAQKLSCPNPTIEVSGGRLNKVTSTTYHPVWNYSPTDGWSDGLSY